jgi:transcriptional regulator of acetoin/glycerol metabolism
MYLQATSGHPEGDIISSSEVAIGRAQWERERLLEVLKEHRWHRQKAAEALGVDRTTLWRKMKKFNISP